MEDNFHHRNSPTFPVSSSLENDNNYIHGIPAMSSPIRPNFSIPHEINNISIAAAQNLNPNLPENFYDLLAEFNHLTLPSPTTLHNQFPKGLMAIPQHHSAFPSGGFMSRVNGSMNTGCGSSLTRFDSSPFPIPANNIRYVEDLRYRDLQRMRGQMGMCMQFHGHGYPQNYLPVEDSGRLNSNVITSRSFNPNWNSNLFSHVSDQDTYVRQRGTGFGHDYAMPSSSSIRNGLRRFRRYDHENLVNLTTSGSYNRSWHGYDFTSLEELKGNIYLVAKDQRGCRFLQKILEGGKAEEIQMIYSEIKDHVKDLMVDSFANYFIQKIFAICRVEQITHLLIVVISDEYSFTQLCRNSHGTRAMQKLIEYLTTPKQRSLFVSALVHVTVPLTKCTNGNHVIQHCLKCLPIEDTKHILNVVAENCLDIATDRSGCCVLQQCVAHAEGDCRNALLTEIVANALVLSEDRYGNYVVQYILSLKIPQVTSDILAQLEGKFVSLSMNKHGSNVVEKCMKESSEDQAMRIIDEIIHDENFMTVVQDAFGNYVAQSALAIAKGSIRQEMVNLIQMHYSCLHNNPHGKRILAKARAGSKLRI